MSNKELQEQRMKSYFIEATKSILKAEGLKSLSVRNIADQAGYSYATLYNYFRDVNDLVFLCVSDFQEEIRSFVNDKTGHLPEGTEKLKATILAYMDYFVEYPGIFELFFLERIRDFNAKKSTLYLICNSLNEICESSWNYHLQNNLIKEPEILPAKEQIKLVVTGILLFYLNRQTPVSYLEYTQLSNQQIDFFLNCIFRN
ncbi:MAG TPA: TetR/AcrR family transcriptional regulator [Bacteroidales bacterium]|nr:TetR/AcrR family transcriptional regulator [Bacteroidales bacterium]HPR59040.1 TetR/AcrR family transcriptional regulator [Bacteroidales bacterium]HRW97162.1 TetR/AcrR family transcriptional regulator [Bacteroidales bacterium]